MTPDLYRMAEDAERSLDRLLDRLVRAAEGDDGETVRWLHRRVLSVERDAQTREAGR